MSQTELLSRITIEPGKMSGKPCIRGMRLRVVDVLDILASGGTTKDVLETFDELVEEDVLAALAYAAEASNRTSAPMN